MDKTIIRDIKSRFFALRNGVVADRLRSCGSPYKIIFGLLIPQVENIAASLTPSTEIADALWDNRSTRESRLLATMVHPLEAMTTEKALRWGQEADTIELADVLCFRLLRNLDNAEDLAYSLLESRKYMSLRLLMNLLILRRLSDVERARLVAANHLNDEDVAVKRVCNQLIDEIDWISQSN